MNQLTLFPVEAEALRTLQEDYDILAADYRYVDARYEALKQEHHALRQALAAKEREVVLWQDLARQVGRVPGATDSTLASILRKLLVLTHPDRWSQGQDAAQLAHELTVTINSLREEIRP